MPDSNQSSNSLSPQSQSNRARSRSHPIHSPSNPTTHYQWTPLSALYSPYPPMPQALRPIPHHRSVTFPKTKRNIRPQTAIASSRDGRIVCPSSHRTPSCTNRNHPRSCTRRHSFLVCIHMAATYSSHASRLHQDTLLLSFHFPDYIIEPSTRSLITTKYATKSNVPSALDTSYLLPPSQRLTQETGGPMD